MKKLIHISRKHYFPKMLGGHPAPKRPGFLFIFVSWITSFAALSTLYGLSYITHSIMIMGNRTAKVVLRGMIIRV